MLHGPKRWFLYHDSPVRNKWCLGFHVHVSENEVLHKLFYPRYHASSLKYVGISFLPQILPCFYIGTPDLAIFLIWKHRATYDQRPIHHQRWQRRPEFFLGSAAGGEAGVHTWSRWMPNQSLWAMWVICELYVIYIYICVIYIYIYYIYIIYILLYIYIIYILYMWAIWVEICSKSKLKMLNRGEDFGHTDVSPGELREPPIGATHRGRTQPWHLFSCLLRNQCRMCWRSIPDHHE